MKKATYQKGESAGLDGIKFQVYILAILLLNSMQKLDDNWKLSTENEQLGDYNKFDDAILELDAGVALLIQAKHKKKVKKKKTAITLDQLLTTNSKNDNFSLPKYFFSFLKTLSQFKEGQTVVMCTNESLDSNVSSYLTSHDVPSDSTLYYSDGCSYYTFNKKILAALLENAKIYLQTNLKGKGFVEEDVTEEKVEKFLENFHFYSNYQVGIPAIEDLLTDLKDLDDLFSRATPDDVYNKVQDWFGHPKGEYLTESRAKALFCEINSDKYFEKLENYNLSFEGFLDIEPKMLTHIVVDGEYFLLHAIRIHQILKGKNQKMLCISPEDDTQTQKEVVEAFTLPTFRFLIIIWWNNATDEVIPKLREILKADKEKKVVFIASKDLQQIQLLDADIIYEYVTLLSFSKTTRDKLSRIKNIIFQGKKINLTELFSTHKDYEKEINSETLIKLVTKETLPVGFEVATLDEDLSHYYIDRILKRVVKKNDKEATDFEKREETFSEQDIFNVNEKVVAIMDSAGTGKSTVLTRLASRLKEKNPFLWVIRLELSEYTKVLREALTKNKRTVDVVSVLNSNSTTKLTNKLEKIVFSLSGKVILMLDGVDEISPDYTNLIMNLLQRCYNAPNFIKLFITGRSHMTELLSQKFETKPFTLQPLTAISQRHFLTKYWLRNLEIGNVNVERCEEYAVALIYRMSLWIKSPYGEETTFTAVPLQVKMLADIFIESNQLEESDDWQGCYEYVTGEEPVPKLPLEMNISMLYQMFVDRKKKVFVDKGNPTGIPAANQALIDQFNEYLVHHRMLALEVILENSKCELFSFYSKDGLGIKESVLKIGIIQKFDKDFRFMHRTFAEYFFADSVLTDLKNNRDEEFQKFLFDEILSHPKFNIIRTFFDKLLGKHVDSLPADIFQNYQSLAYDIHLWQSSKLLYQLVEGGCVAILQLLFKCIDFKIFKDKEGEHAEILMSYFGSPIPEFVSSNKLAVLQNLTSQSGVNIKDGDQIPLHRAVQGKSIGMVKFLVDRGANTNSRDRVYRTPLYYALDSFEIVQFLVEHDANVKAEDSRGRTVLEDAILSDKLQIATYLFDTISNNEDIDVNENCIIPYAIAYLGRLELLKQLESENKIYYESALGNGETLIFGAARGAQEDTLNFLIFTGANYHVQDEEGNTVLHFTSQKTSLLPIAELLMEVGMHVNVNVKNFRGDTPLHLGVASLDMVKLLIENGADLNSVNGGGETPLALAISKGFLETAKFLVDNGADADVSDNYGNTLLHLSVSCELKLCEYVVQLGVDMDIKNFDGRTACHLAALKGYLDILNLFLDNGGDVNIRDKSNMNVFNVATLNGHLNVVKFLIGREDVELVEYDGRTPLHLVANRGHPDMVQYFVELGIDINKKDNKGKTGLHIAASLNSCLETVKIFVKLGADLEDKDNKHCTPFHLAALMQQWNTLKFLLDCMGYANGENYKGTIFHFINREGQRFETPINRNVVLLFLSGRTAFHEGALNGQMDVVKFYIELGVDVNIQADDGTTPLHAATFGGRFNIVQYLLHCGADVRIPDNMGRSVLHFAMQSGQIPLVELILEREVDINVTDNEGRTSLHYAIYSCHLKLIKFLVERGINVNVRYKDESTILHVSVARGLLEATKLFVEHGGDINAKNDCGYNALHLAAGSGLLQTFKFLVDSGGYVGAVDNGNHTMLHASAVGGYVEIAKIVIESGVAVDATDCDGCTALHLAADRGNLDFIIFLFDSGADIHTKDLYGRTALHYAVLKGHLETVVWLVEQGADVNVADNNGCTALHLAALENHTVKVKGITINIGKVKLKQNVFKSVVIFLLEHGADISCKSAKGETAAVLADRCGNFYLMRYLLPKPEQ